MGKMLKPNKPKVKKLRVPRKPAKPKEYLQEVALPIPRGYSSGTDPLDVTHLAVVNNKKEVILKDEKFKLRIPGPGSSRSRYRNNLIYFCIRNPKYDSEMKTYSEKMISYHERLKKIKPELDEYEAVMAEYEYQLALYETEQREKALEKAKKKLNVA